ncbi:PH domain-containing protein [Sphingorhabdus arenilitoris]|uniref:PH domain-containing protein n=1 Tax=Sphingorhabdus arenilitoris TaxID=1490041 RepID=A0ABV8RER0_9SPHN
MTPADSDISALPAPEVQPAEPITDGTKLSLMGVFAAFITGLPNLIFPILAAIFGARSSGAEHILIPVILGLALGGSLFFRWLDWTRFRYFVGEEDIRIESGILFRKARSIPYERIQDVSIEQKLVARIFGLGEVKFETGGGAGEDGQLSYVSLHEAQRLRELIKARKSDITAPAAFGEAGIASSDSEGAQAPEQPPIFAMDNRRILTLGFYSFSLVIFAVLFGVLNQFDWLLPFDLWDWTAWLGIAKERGATLDGLSITARAIAALMALFGLILLGFATGIVRTLLREYGFRLDQTEKGFRRRRGLFTLTDVVMPVHRVQAVTVFTGPIRKLRGWYGLKFISLAGDSSASEKGESDHVAAPLATWPEISKIAEIAGVPMPDANVVLIRGKLVYWLNILIFIIPVVIAGIAVLIAFTDAGALAIWLLAVIAFFTLSALLQWRLSLHAHSGPYIFVRRGWWNQKLTAIPQIKIQSVEITQGPITRLQGLCCVHFGIAGGSISIPAIPLADGRALCQTVMANIVNVDYSELNRP